MLIKDKAQRDAAARKKRETLLTFLRDETWSTGEVLRRLVGIQSRQAIHRTLSQMEAQELVKRHDMAIPGGRLMLWGITPHGLAFSWPEGETPQQRPHFEPSRLTLSRIPHQVDLQKARLSAELAGWSGWMRGERMDVTKFHPDAVVQHPKGHKVAIELERTIKTRKRYQQIIKEHLLAVRGGHWRKVAYVTPEAVAPRLKAVFDSIQYVVINGQRVPLEDSHRAVFEFYELDQFALPPEAA